MVPGGRGPQIQTKLKELGLYTGNIDGSTATAPKNAVIAFQSKGPGCRRHRRYQDFNRPGPLAKRGGNGQFSDSDVALLARTISAEARGEPYTGQVAVER